MILTMLPVQVFAKEDGRVALVKDGVAAPIYIDAEGDAYDGISLIAEAAAGDIEAVTGVRPEVLTASPTADAGTIIIAGTLEDALIEDLGLTWEISPSNGDYTSDNWERYQIQVVVTGGQTQVVVAGADKRGTIYGLFHITQDLCGVSPWYYWGDVPITEQDTLEFTKAELETTSEVPSVRYRGIFLNDEAPSLTGFVSEQFGNYNYLFYANVYELILRLKGNYLWPAMWSNTFSEDGILNISKAKDTRNADKLAENERTAQANAILADHYGVVMGTSHHEPMYRAGEEWQNLQSGSNPTYTYPTDQNASLNEWNYFLNSQNIDAFWDDGVKRNQNYESVITIGMRGESDSELKHPDGTVLTLQENIQVLKNAITSQKSILEKYNLSDAPQLLVLYKEVENFWYGEDSTGATAEGLNQWDELDDTIIMLCEDNQGNLRTLPNEDERDRAWGMYYHFDYHGGPRSYEWIDTVPLARIWDNMTTAYDYGVDDIWIVNVGDLKPMELPISYFLDLAYDFDTWGTDNQNSTEDYTKQWVEQQFDGSGLTSDDLDEIADVLKGYTDLNGQRKPEIVSSSTYSTVNYNEAQRVLAEAVELQEKADALLEKMPAAYKDAYWQLVYYPAAATANINQMQIFQGLNQLYAARGSAAANAYADLVEECIQRDQDLTAYYNKTMSNGYWNKMMSSAHVGYVAWKDEGWSYPTPTYVQLANGGVLLVDVEGTEEAAKSGNLTLPDFTNTGNECYALTLSNGGDEAVAYSVTTSADWIQVATGEGSLYTAKTLAVSVDWSKVSGDETGTITITGAGATVTVTVNAKMLDTEGLAEHTFLMSNNVISMEVSSYSAKGVSADGSTSWEILTGYGKTKDTAKTYPTTNSFEGTNGPWLEYTVNIPQAGTYTLTTYVGPSNNLHSDTGLRYGVSIDGGDLTVKDSLPDGYVSGDGNNTGWKNSVMNMGRTATTTHTLSAGVHTIRIYGLDAGLQLEKLVLSQSALATSYLGPQESYYVGKTIAQQPLVCYQIQEAMSIPGVIRASDCNENADSSNTVLNAVSGTTYTYLVSAQTSGDYAFSVKATASEGTTATLTIGGKSVTIPLGTAADTYYTADTLLSLSTGGQELQLTVSGDAAVEEILAETVDTTVGTKVTVSASSNSEDADNIFDQTRTTTWKPAEDDLAAPYVELNFGQTTYFDWFKLSGSLSSVTGYTISMYNEGEWQTVYTGTTLTNGEKQYVYGHTPCVGTKLRFTFTGCDAAFNISQLQLNTFINWALADQGTTATATVGEGVGSSGVTNVIDGDRIGSDSNDKWQSPSGQYSIGANGGSVTLTFSEAHTLTGVHVLGYNRDANQQHLSDVIPDETTTSDAVSKGYTISYLDENGTWQTATTHTPDSKVLSVITFDAPITTTAVKLTVSTSFWIRVVELEPVEQITYKLDGEAVRQTLKLAALDDLSVILRDTYAKTEIPVSVSAGEAEVTLSATSSDPDVADVTAADGTLTLTPSKAGSATITVTASAPGYERAERTFSVTVKDLANLAQDTSVGATVTTNGGGTVSYITDGVVDDTNKRWRTSNKPATIEFSWDQEVTISELHLFSQKANSDTTPLSWDSVTNLGITSGTLYAYDSGTGGWTAVQSFSDNSYVWNKMVLKSPVTTTKVKLDLTGADGWVRILEIEVWGVVGSGDDTSNYSVTYSADTLPAYMSNITIPQSVTVTDGKFIPEAATYLYTADSWYYTFSCWMDADKNEYKAGTGYDVKGNLTLTPVWELYSLNGDTTWNIDDALVLMQHVQDPTHNTLTTEQLALTKKVTNQESNFNIDSALTIMQKIQNKELVSITVPYGSAGGEIGGEN